MYKSTSAAVSNNHTLGQQRKGSSSSEKNRLTDIYTPLGGSIAHLVAVQHSAGEACILASTWLLL